MKNTTKKMIYKLSLAPKVRASTKLKNLKWLIGRVSFIPLFIMVYYWNKLLIPIEVLSFYLILICINFWALFFTKSSPYRKYFIKKEFIYFKKYEKWRLETFYEKYNDIMSEKEMQEKILRLTPIWYKNNNLSSSFMSLMKYLAKKDIHLIESLEKRYCLEG